MSAAWSDPLVDDEAPDPIVLALMVDAPDPAEVLAAYLAKPSWHAQAACRGMGTDAFFIERGGDPRPAKALCADCPVVEPCRAAGADEVVGIWGGTSPQERRSIRSSGRLKRPRRQPT